MVINVGDIVNVSLERGVLVKYEILTIPGKNEVYWEAFPVGKPDEITVFGPSLVTIVKTS